MSFLLTEGSSEGFSGCYSTHKESNTPPFAGICCDRKSIKHSCTCPQHLLNIHFHAPALGAALLAKDEGASVNMAPTSAGRSRAAMLYFVFNADVVAVLVAHDLRVGEFVAQARLCGPSWGI